MPMKHPESYRKNIVQLYLSGLSQRAISEQVGSDQKWISKVLRNAGVSRSLSSARRQFFARGGKPPNFISDLPVDSMCTAYRGGHAAQVIAKPLGISVETVKRRIVAAGTALRSHAEAHLLIDRQKASALTAQSKSRLCGWGEDILCQWLADRGKLPDTQVPVGTKNLDLAIHPITVEVWLSSALPFNDPYCMERIKYLANRGWSSLYVFISRRTKVLLPAVADKIVTILEQAHLDPSVLSQHWVIRGCGELAATASFDLHDQTIIPPSMDCPYHRPINKRFAR